MSPDLRPLTLAELLDRSFSTYKQHLWLFVGIMAVPSVFAMTMAVLLQLFNAGARRGVPPDQVWRQMLPMMAGSFVFSIVYLLAYAFALGATTIAVSQLYLGRIATVRSTYETVRPHGWRLVALLLWGILRLGGTWIGLIVLMTVVSSVLAIFSRILSVLVFIVGMLGASLLVGFMAVRYGVAVPAVVLENIPARAGLRRSVELTEANLGRVFLLMLCAMVIAYATAAVLQGPFMMGAFLSGLGTPTATMLTIVGAILGGIGGMFSGPIMIISLSFMYYDLRIRKEGLDLHMMLDALDPPSSLGVAAAPRQV